MGRVIKICALSESGDLNYALKVFALLPHPETFIYNIMLIGYLQAHLYRNCITLSSKGISSWNCMIGGFAMHGKGKAAIELLKKMEAEAMVTPDYVTFGNVLAACAHSGLVEERRYYFSCMTKVYGIAPGMEHYGCLVDLLRRAGLLEEARKVINDIYIKVEEMLISIKDLGYVPDTDGMLYDICEEETENPLHYHSDKLAIAFGLLKTKTGETIRVTKNLRVCNDCHQASKLISKVYDREIIVRDREYAHVMTTGNIIGGQKCCVLPFLASLLIVGQYCSD